MRPQTEIAMSEVPQPNPHHATRRRMFLGLTLALALFTVWTVWWFRGAGEDPRITEIRTLQRELAAKYPPGQAISGPADAAARVAAIGQVMAKVQQLPPELRPQAMRLGQDTFRKMMDGKVSTYFSLPAEKRQDSVSPARGPPTDWGEFVQIHDDRDVFQASPDELPAIDIHNRL
jgi:hypothetical protein